jgi:DNA-directed RNA polymerase subunit RPC12/RpoP
MRKIRCPQCDEFIAFDESRIEARHALAFRCNHCGKDFSVKFKSKEEKKEQDYTFGYIIVVENVFCKKQIIPLLPDKNVFGRRSKGTVISSPIETGDMSMDRNHCIIYAEQKQDKIAFAIKDLDSVTGTFVMNDILRKNERRILSDGDIITLGATTLILKTPPNLPE